MSWRSTELYYRRLNQALEARLGPHHSFQGVVWNLDYAALIAAASVGRWQQVEDQILAAVRGLGASGCDVLVLTAVTAHRFYDSIARAAVGAVPHVLEGAGRTLDALGVDRVGLLGTDATCVSDFADRYLAGKDRRLLRLADDAQRILDELIQGALTQGGITAAGRAVLEGAIRSLERRGAQAVVLACTELPLLLPLSITTVPLLDCVALHVDDICQLIVSPDHADPADPRD